MSVRVKKGWFIECFRGSSVAFLNEHEVIQNVGGSNSAEFEHLSERDFYNLANFVAGLYGFTAQSVIMADTRFWRAKFN